MHAGLECRIGHGKLIVPAAAIERLDEFAVAPGLPTWPRRVSGVGVCADLLVAVISLARVASAPARTATGLLLRSREHGMRWALEITAPVGLVQVDSLVPNEIDTEARPRWMWSAAASDRGSLLWIDVDGLLAAMEGPS